MSVIVITYNHSAYIRDALDGILGQHVDFPFEVIVHDDASTDGTADVVRQYAVSHPAVIPYLEEVNKFGEIPSALQRCVSLARGKYIAFTEGDDYWVDPSKLQVQYDYLEKNPDHSACVHNAYILDLTNDLVYLSEPWGKDRDKTYGELVEEGGGQLNPTASFFFRKEALDFGYMGCGAPVGDHFWLMSFARHGKVRFMTKPMSVYRYGSAGCWTFQPRGKEWYISYFEGYRRGLLYEDEASSHLASEHIGRAIELRESQMKKRLLSCGCSFSEAGLPDEVMKRSEAFGCCVKAKVKSLLPNSVLRGRARVKKRFAARRQGLLVGDLRKGAPSEIKPLGMRGGE
ncbi:glycosyltransferase family 2 protein [Adlercreutzia sp. ZJ242]|uniref:glycosyltransferase family 2 protein n=1 Tax=Adlercreutzia sp. ZJ242 TaxID=2709409 RepID=UPI0013E9E251|nr:glycosyltransferase family 2 protein [Adlercreutzia sp. ZJ242]